MALVQLKEPVKSIWQEWLRWYRRQGVQVTFRERTQALIYAQQGIRPSW